MKNWKNVNGLPDGFQYRDDDGALWQLNILKDGSEEWEKLCDGDEKEQVHRGPNMENFGQIGGSFPSCFGQSVYQQTGGYKAGNAPKALPFVMLLFFIFFGANDLICGKPGRPFGSQPLACIDRR